MSSGAILSFITVRRSGLLMRAVMRERIAGSAISSPRFSSDANVLKTTGTIGAALPSGKAATPSTIFEHHANSGAPVFLASARLRNTWCELSERPDNSRSVEYGKQAQSNSESAHSKDFNIVSGKKLFPDEFKKTSVTAQDFTPVSKTVDSNVRSNTGGSKESSASSENSVSRQAGASSQRTDAGSSKSLFQAQTATTFNITSKTSAGTGSQSSTQLFSKSSAVMNEVSKNLKAETSQGSQIFNVRSSVLSADSLSLSSGKSESTTKQYPINVDTPVFKSDSVQKPAATLSAKLLKTLPQQTAANVKVASQSLPAQVSQTAANVKVASQSLPAQISQTASQLKETSQQSASPVTTGSSPAALPSKAASSTESLQTQGVLLTGSAKGKSAVPEGMNALNIEGEIPVSDEMPEHSTGRAIEQQYDDTLMQKENALLKYDKMTGQSLLYGTPLNPHSLEKAFNYAPFAQSSLWDSLRLIWKTFLTSTEAELQEFYSPPQEPYSGRGGEKGQRYAVSSGLMNQDAVLTIPVRAFTESDMQKHPESEEKPPEKTSGKEGAEKGSLLMREEKTASLHIPDSEEEQNEEGGGDRSSGGGEEKDGKEQEKEGKKNRDQGKGKEGRSGDEGETKEDRDADREDKDDELPEEKDLDREVEIQGGESAEYLPMWDFTTFADSECSARYKRNRRLYWKISESYPPCHCAESTVRLTCIAPIPHEPTPSFPLFAQIYAESTSPMGLQQMPPPKVFVNQEVLRRHLLDMLEMSLFQPLRMTARASKFVASAIGDIIRKRYRLKDITKEYFASYVAMLMRISGEFTFSHSLRTMDLALEIAEKAMIDDQEIMEQVRFGAFFKDIGELDFLLSRLPIKEKDSIAGFLASRDLKWAGILHDIGKIRIPREVLYKPGVLSDEEFSIMKMHPIYSEQILYPVMSLRFLCPVVRAHHERWDGKGYPDRIEGNAIPVAARIIAIADVFDALISDRPYKKGMAWPRVKKIMTEGRGTHFDPYLLDIFLRHITPMYEQA